MKKVLYAPVFVLLLTTACNENKNNEALPNEKALGMVLQTPTSGSPGLVLLKNGQLINPVSGFNPARLSAGAKFVISYKPIATNGKIINAQVTNYSLATDSLFVPLPPSAADTVAFKAALQGTHNCIATFVSVNYSNPSDTTKLILKKFEISFTGNEFEAGANYGPVPGGVGTFYFSGVQPNNLYFLNYAHFSSECVPEGFLLNGNYYYAVFDRYITLWKYTDNSYSGFLIER